MVGERGRERKALKIDKTLHNFHIVFGFFVCLSSAYPHLPNTIIYIIQVLYPSSLTHSLILYHSVEAAFDEKKEWRGKKKAAVR
jgi:hypothetical protein